MRIVREIGAMPFFAVSGKTFHAEMVLVVYGQFARSGTALYQALRKTRGLLECHIDSFPLWRCH